MRGVHQLPARIERHVRAPATRWGARRWRPGSRRPRRSARRRGCGSGRRRPRSAEQARGSIPVTRRAASGSRRRRRRAASPARARRRAARSTDRDVGGEPPLVGPQRGLRETGPFVQHRQQREADAGRRLRRRPARGTSPAGRHRARRRRVVQVVELADLRVAAAAAARRTAAPRPRALSRRDAQRDAVHAVAPATRSRRGRRRAVRPGRRTARWNAWLWASTRPGSTGPGSTRRAGRQRGVAGADAGPAAVGTGVQQHARLDPAPARARRRGAHRPGRAAQASGLQSSMVCTSRAQQRLHGRARTSSPAIRRRLVHVARQHISSCTACTPVAGGRSGA